MSRESWYQIHIPARVGKPLQKDAKCLCSVHVHAIVANNSVWKIQNFAQFVYIVFLKPELRLTLVICHQVQIELFVAPIWNIRIFRRINVIQKQAFCSIDHITGKR